MSFVTKIFDFINYERGAESVEFGIVTITIAGGAAAGLTLTKNTLQAKNDVMLATINVDPS